MKKNDNPKLVYQEIIDNIVEDSNSITSQLILKHCIYSKAKDKDKYNDFVATLNGEQRILLAEMMNEERKSAFHDVLAILSWWIECKDITLCYKGDEIPVDLSGMGLHGDYIGRLDDWKWPE